MTLEENNVNHELGNVDLSKITALQQKRTIAFINHFVLTNVQFLNKFMKKCEQNLMNFERKLEKINAAMVLLEARLSSIPELGTTPVTPTSSDDPLSHTTPPQKDAVSKPLETVTPTPPEVVTLKSPEVVNPKPPEVVTPKTPDTLKSLEVVTPKTPEVSQESPSKSNSQTGRPVKLAESVGENKSTSSPEYDRFLKMVHVGVPLPAVKLKVIQQGLDPNVLDELLGK